MIFENRVDNRCDNKTKNTLTFSALEKFIEMDYLISGTKKTLNFLWNLLIQIPVFQNFDLDVIFVSKPKHLVMLLI